jgi:selenocysteine-specific elongation factor
MARVAVAEVISSTASDASASGGGEPLAPTTVPPGGRARARLRLESPLIVTRGDRFVLRAYSPVTTIGGGLVIDPHPARGPLRTSAGLARFGELVGTDEHALRVMLDERGREGLPLIALGTRLGLRGDAAMAAMAERITGTRDGQQTGYAVRIGDLLISRAVIVRLSGLLVAQVKAHHAAQPDSEGLPREEARDRLDVTARVFDFIVERLTAAGTLGGRDRLALPAHRAAVPDVDAAALARAESIVRDAGLKPPDAAEFAQQMGLPAAAADRLIQFLVRQKRLVKIGALVFHTDALTLLKDETRALKAGAVNGRATVDVASFKTRYGVSRKFAIPLLEYLDRERVTRRAGDERIVL